MPEVKDLPAKPVELLSHVLAATNIWYCRLKGESSDFAVWEQFSPADWQSRLDDNYAGLKDYLNTLEEQDFDRLITYKTSSGIEFTTSVKDILSHVFWHTGYHHGQIVMLLKPVLQPLPDLNFITFVRKGGV